MRFGRDKFRRLLNNMKTEFLIQNLEWKPTIELKVEYKMICWKMLNYLSYALALNVLGILIGCHRRFGDGLPNRLDLWLDGLILNFLKDFELILFTLKIDFQTRPSVVWGETPQTLLVFIVYLENRIPFRG